MSSNNPMSNIPPLGPPTGMMPRGGPGKFKPIDPMRVLRANWLWIVLAMIFGGGLGTGVWYGLNREFANYTSEAQFNVTATNVDITTGRSSGTMRMVDLEPIILREVATIKNEPILRTILNAPEVQQTKWFKQFDGNMVDALEELDEEVLSAGPIRDTPLFIARAKTPEKLDAQVILNALQTEYMRLKGLQESEQADIEMEAARRRLNSAEEKITTIRAAISRFLNSTPLETLDERSSEAALQVQRLVVEKNELDKSFNSLTATHAQLQQRLAENNFDPSDEERYLIENTQEIIQLDSQLRQLRISRELQLEKYGVEHEIIKSLDKQILETEREREKEFDEQARTSFNAKFEQATLGLSILTEELNKAIDALAEWTVKRQETVGLLNDYETFQRELEAAEIEKDKAEVAIEDLIEYNNIRARVEVELSIPPQEAKQSWPPKPYITIPVVAGLFTALITGLIFLRELMDQRVRSATDVKMIPDAALLGMIPDAGQDQRSGSIERVVESAPSGLLAESFRQVRTAVLSKMDRRGYKTLMTVSAKPGAGATAVAQNLGASCALSGRRVLIIDANFRRPGMAGLMGLGGSAGLAELLNGEHAVDDALELARDSGTHGLSVLSAGQGQGVVELFESPRFRELLAKLESEYDLLIIDAPPALLTSDAQLLSRHVDAMVLVSRARTDTRGMLQRLYRELDGQRADILGVVLNGVQASAGGYLKRNYREFAAYSGPERRKADRSNNGAPRPAPVAVPEPASNGAAADLNDETVRIEPPIEDAPIAADNTPDGDDDTLGGFDLFDEEDTNK